MADYTFWTGVFDAWKATSDGIKALMILTPPGFALGTLALLLRHRRDASPALATPQPSEADRRPPAALIPDEVEQLDDLRHRLNEARRVLPIRAALPQIDPASVDIEAEIRRMIVEDFRQNKPPQEALERVRRLLGERRGDEREREG